MDIYDGDGPLILLVHGGFWRAAYDRQHLRPLAAALAGAGAAVGLPEFRRVGQAGGGWPGTVEDVLVSLRNLVRLHPDRGPVTLVGHSSGGHLAVLAALRCSPEVVCRVVSLAGVLDFSAARRDGVSDGAADEFLGDRTAADEAAADPMLQPVPLMSVTVVHGEDDDQVDPAHSIRYARKDRRIRQLLLPGTDHYDLIDPASGVYSVVEHCVLG